MEQKQELQELATSLQQHITIVDAYDPASLSASQQQQLQQQAASHWVYLSQIQELLNRDDPEAALRSNPSQINELFLGVLTTKLQAAEQSGQTEEAEKLGRLNATVIQMIQENQPPEIKLISQLLAAEYPDGTRALLEEYQELIGPPLLELMDLLGKDLAEGDREDLGHQLAKLREQAAAMIQG